MYWVPVQEIAGIPKIANRNSDFLTLQKSEFQKKFRPESLDRKRNRNSTSDWGPRNQNQKPEFPTWVSTKKSNWVTLLWSASRCVYFIRPNTLLLCIFLFCIFLLYPADSQVEVQIRILVKDKYRKSCQKCEHRQSHFDFLNNAYWVSFLRETTC